MTVDTAIRALLVAAGLAGVLACGPGLVDVRSHLVEERRLAMGSELYLTAYAASTAEEPAARAAFAEVFAEFERLEGLLSVWREDSDVAHVNQAAGQTPVTVHDDTRRVLHAAAQVSAWTDGKFDITFGALAEVWKFDHDQDNRVPTAAEIAARVPRVDHTAVIVDDGRGTAFLTRPDVRVHLGGIGKGYAVDRAVAILRAAGLRDFMVQAGGDLYVGGRAGDTPWRLGIQDPRGSGGEPFATVEVADATFSTSGDYERFFDYRGVRYHHLIDPGTAAPRRTAVHSVTVLGDTTINADAASTAVFGLDRETAQRMARRVLRDAEIIPLT